MAEEREGEEPLDDDTEGEGREAEVRENEEAGEDEPVGEQSMG